MSRKALFVIPLLIGLSLAAPRPAAAQFAVIDAAAIGHLIEQYETLQDQLTTALDHLEQARLEYEALTGDRGMQHLLADTWRNYLPGHWQALTDALYGLSADFPAFAQAAHRYLETNAILTPEELERFSDEDRAHIDAQRHSMAALQALTQQAMGENSERFNGLQQLIDAIADASDPKAIFDLQARIGAEQVMVANDANKLHALFQAVQAEQQAQRQQRQEQAIRDIGSLRDLPPLDLPVAP